MRVAQVQELAIQAFDAPGITAPVRTGAIDRCAAPHETLDACIRMAYAQRYGGSASHYCTLPPDTVPSFCPRTDGICTHRRPGWKHGKALADPRSRQPGISATPTALARIRHAVHEIAAEDTLEALTARAFVSGDFTAVDASPARHAWIRSTATRRRQTGEPPLGPAVVNAWRAEAQWRLFSLVAKRLRKHG